MAARSFAAGQLTFRPGFYTLEHDQRLMLARLRTQDVPLVVTDQEQTYLVNFASQFTLIHEFIMMHYELVGELPALAGDPVRVTFQLLDFDAKRMHYFEQLFHATEGWVSATSENMSLHVDMAAGKTAPFPDEVASCLARMKAAHGHLPRPEAAGCRIAMR